MQSLDNASIIFFKKKTNEHIPEREEMIAFNFSLEKKKEI